METHEFAVLRPDQTNSGAARKPTRQKRGTPWFGRLSLKLVSRSEYKKHALQLSGGVPKSPVLECRTQPASLRSPFDTTQRMRPARGFRFICGLAAASLAAFAAPGMAESPPAELSTSVGSHIPAASSSGTRVVRVIGREDILQSGLTSLNDLLISRGAFNNFGLRRSMVLGSSRTAFLVNGHSLLSRTSDYFLQLLPLSAIERIEILADSSAAIYEGGAIGGAINIVLRSEFDGFEFHSGLDFPDSPGADAQQAGTIWGGTIGRGHLVIAADVFSRDEINSADRDHSRASWTPGGSFRDTIGVSEFGNTVVVGGVVKPLSDCSGDGYTGLLTNSLRFGANAACGLATGNTGWTANPMDRESVYTSFEHPLSEHTSLYATARLGRLDTAFKGAAAYGALSFAPTQDLRASLLADPDIDEVPDTVTGYLTMLGHGDIHVWSAAKEQDFVLGVRTRTPGGPGWNAYVRSNTYKLTQGGGTLVHQEKFKSAVEDGRYDLADPLSDDPDHLKAVRESSLEVDVDLKQQHRSAGLSVDGEGFALPGGNTRWVMGAEIEEAVHHDFVDFFNPDDPSTIYTFEDILGFGSSGFTYSGERRRFSVFGEMLLPPAPDWTVSVAARQDDYDDVGAAYSSQVSTAYHVTPTLTVHGTWARGSQPPTIKELNSDLRKSAVRICDTKNHDGPLETCDRVTVQHWSGGNSELKPDRGESRSVGVTTQTGPLIWNASWFRTSSSGFPTTLPSQWIVDMEAAGEPLPSGAKVYREAGDGKITRIDSPWVNAGDAAISGVDFQVGAEWELGQVDVSMDLSWLHVSDYEVMVSGVTQPGDYPSDRMHASLRVSEHGTTVGWDVHSISGYDLVTSAGKFGTWEAWVGHDLSVKWDDPFDSQDTYITAGILNVADKGPPMTASYPSFTSRSLDSVRGRTFFLRTGVSW